MTSSLAINLNELPFKEIVITEPEKIDTISDEDIYNKEFAEKSKQTFDRLENQISQWIYSVVLPQKWLTEEIVPPTIECKNKAESTALKLYKDFHLHPIRISPSIEEGIFIKYVNHENKKELSIEIYNDLDIAAIITKNNEIIFSRDISDESFSEIQRIYHTT
ncbi:MAG: hypothetical protein V3R54_06220 [Thermodesulfovibrionia bacterium]